jgi:hypothetical protein
MPYIDGIQSLSAVRVLWHLPPSCKNATHNSLEQFRVNLPNSAVAEVVPPAPDHAS